MANRIVAKITRQPSAKTRQTGAQGDFETFLIVGNKVQRITPQRLDDHTILHHLGFRVWSKAAGTHQSSGGQANEAVATKALTPHDGFQQKGILAAVPGKRQLQVQRQRGFQICKGFNHQRDAVKALRSQADEFKFCDHG